MPTQSLPLERTSAPCDEAIASSTQWIAYFQANGKKLLDMPWDAGVQLSADERRCLIPSIQDFQLGESSEAENPRRMASRYAQQSGDVWYPDAMRLFLGEEHRHSRLLGRYLDLAGAPRLKFSWDDALFRKLRRAMGMELMLMTLLMAETIAMVYYLALFRASGCPLLKRICAQLLRDEKPHVEFHVERLAIMRRGRSRGVQKIVNGAHRILFTATCLVVWKRHAGVMRQSGHTFRSFWRNCWREFRRVLR
ncbi:MAG: ferritin-like domain-containing protein [Planctomycetota bacterium]